MGSLEENGVPICNFNRKLSLQVVIKPTMTEIHSINQINLLVITVLTNPGGKILLIAMLSMPTFKFVGLLQIKINCCKANHTADTILHSSIIYVIL
jgi:hypothetical protein